MTRNLKIMSRYRVNPRELAGKLKQWPMLEISLA
jgi:hypothetical protein